MCQTLLQGLTKNAKGDKNWHQNGFPLQCIDLKIHEGYTEALTFTKAVL